MSQTAESATDTVVYFFHQHGPKSAGGRFEQWNPPVGIGVPEEGLVVPNRVEDQLLALYQRPEFAVPDGHWSRMRVLPRDTAPRGKDLAGRYRGVQSDLAAHPELLAEIRSQMQCAEMYVNDTSAGVPLLYTSALGWLSEGETDPVRWARMVRHAIACGITHPRVAYELGVDLARVYAVVADPWREHFLSAAALFRSGGAIQEAEREERRARARERAMEP